jgi:hypothetical protein
LSGRAAGQEFLPLEVCAMSRSRTFVFSAALVAVALIVACSTARADMLLGPGQFDPALLTVHDGWMSGFGIEWEHAGAITLPAGDYRLKEFDATLKYVAGEKVQPFLAVKSGSNWNLIAVGDLITVTADAAWGAFTMTDTTQSNFTLAAPTQVYPGVYWVGGMPMWFYQHFDTPLPAGYDDFSANGQMSGAYTAPTKGVTYAPGYSEPYAGRQWREYSFQIVVSPVPEPGTLALLAGGLIGLLAYAWRKRK